MKSSHRMSVASFGALLIRYPLCGRPIATSSLAHLEIRRCVSLHQLKHGAQPTHQIPHEPYSGCGCKCHSDPAFAETKQVYHCHLELLLLNPFATSEKHVSLNIANTSFHIEWSSHVEMDQQTWSFETRSHDSQDLHQLRSIHFKDPSWNRQETRQQQQHY